jgi:hypothetical protein
VSEGGEASACPSQGCLGQGSSVELEEVVEAGGCTDSWSDPAREGVGLQVGGASGTDVGLGGQCGRGDT